MVVAQVSPAGRLIGEVHVELSARCGYTGSNVTQWILPNWLGGEVAMIRTDLEGLAGFHWRFVYSLRSRDYARPTEVLFSQLSARKRAAVRYELRPARCIGHQGPTELRIPGWNQADKAVVPC